VIALQAAAELAVPHGLQAHDAVRLVLSRRRRKELVEQLLAQGLPQHRGCGLRPRPGRRQEETAEAALDAGKVRQQADRPEQADHAGDVDDAPAVLRAAELARRRSRDRGTRRGGGSGRREGEPPGRHLAAAWPWALAPAGAPESSGPKTAAEVPDLVPHLEGPLSDPPARGLGRALMSDTDFSLN